MELQAENTLESEVLATLSLYFYSEDRMHRLGANIVAKGGNIMDSRGPDVW